MGKSKPDEGKLAALREQGPGSGPVAEENGEYRKKRKKGKEIDTALL